MIMEDTKRVSHLWKPTAVKPLYGHAIGISNLTPSKIIVWGARGGPNTKHAPWDPISMTILRHASVSSTYPCQMFVGPSVRPSVRPSHFRISILSAFLNGHRASAETCHKSLVTFDQCQEAK